MTRKLRTVLSRSAVCAAILSAQLQVVRADPCPVVPGYSTPTELRGTSVCTVQTCGSAGSVWITDRSVVSAFSQGAGTPVLTGLCARSHVQRSAGSYELRGPAKGAGFEWCGVFTLNGATITAFVNNSGSGGSDGFRCEGYTPGVSQAQNLPFTPNPSQVVNCPAAVIPAAYQGDASQTYSYTSGGVTQTQTQATIIDAQGISTCTNHRSQCSQECVMSVTQRQVPAPAGASGGSMVSILEANVATQASAPNTACVWLRVLQPSEVGRGPNVYDLTKTFLTSSGATTCPTAFSGTGIYTSTYENWYPTGSAFSRSPLPSAEPTPQFTAGGSRVPSPTRTPNPRYPGQPPVCPPASAGGVDFLPADVRGSGLAGNSGTAVTIDGSTLTMTSPGNPVANAYLGTVFCIDRIVTVPGYAPARVYKLLGGPTTSNPAPLCVLLRVDDVPNPVPGQAALRRVAFNISTPTMAAPGSPPTDAQGCPLGGDPSGHVVANMGNVADYGSRYMPNDLLGLAERGYSSAGGDTTYFYDGRYMGYVMAGGVSRTRYYVNSETRITLPLDFTPQGVPRGVLGNALIVEFGSYDPQIGARAYTVGCMVLALTAPGYAGGDNGRYAYMSLQFTGPSGQYIAGGCNISRIGDSAHALAFNGWNLLPGTSPLPSLSPSTGASPSFTPTIPVTPTGSLTGTPSGTPPGTGTATNTLSPGAQPSYTPTTTGTPSNTASPRVEALPPGGGGGGGGSNGGGAAAAIIIILALAGGGFYAYKKGYTDKLRGKLLGSKGGGAAGGSAAPDGSSTTTVVSNVLHGGKSAQVTGNSPAATEVTVGASAYSAAMGAGAPAPVAAASAAPAAAGDAVAVAVADGEVKKKEEPSVAPAAAEVSATSGSESVAAASAAGSAAGSVAGSAASATSAIAQAHAAEDAAAVDSIIDVVMHSSVVPEGHGAASAAAASSEAAAVPGSLKAGSAIGSAASSLVVPNPLAAAAGSLSGSAHGSVVAPNPLAAAAAAGAIASAASGPSSFVAPGSAPVAGIAAAMMTSGGSSAHGSHVSVAPSGLSAAVAAAELNASEEAGGWQPGSFSRLNDSALHSAASASAADGAAPPPPPPPPPPPAAAEAAMTSAPGDLAAVLAALAKASTSAPPSRKGSGAAAGAEAALAPPPPPPPPPPAAADVEATVAVVTDGAPPAAAAEASPAAEDDKW